MCIRLCKVTFYLLSLNKIIIPQIGSNLCNEEINFRQSIISEVNYTVFVTTMMFVILNTSLSYVNRSAETTAFVNGMKFRRGFLFCYRQQKRKQIKKLQVN